MINFIARYASKEAPKYPVARFIVTAQSKEDARGTYVDSRITLADGDGYDVRWLVVKREQHLQGARRAGDRLLDDVVPRQPVPELHQRERRQPEGARRRPQSLSRPNCPLPKLWCACLARADRAGYSAGCAAASLCVLPRVVSGPENRFESLSR